MNNADILLIEDDPEDRRVIVSVLESTCPRTRIRIAKDGAEAVDTLRDATQRASALRLILLDIKLPKLSGLEVLKWLRSEPAHQCTPVVVLTSSREAPDLQRAYQLGANSFLCKPIEIDEFIDVVKSIGLYWMVLNEVPS